MFNEAGGVFFFFTVSPTEVLNGIASDNLQSQFVFHLVLLVRVAIKEFGAMLIPS